MLRRTVVHVCTVMSNEKFPYIYLPVKHLDGISGPIARVICCTNPHGLTIVTATTSVCC